VPPKDEIENAMAALYEVSGDQHLYFAADRFANNGSADFGFWFFRNEITLNPDGTFDGVHEVGDVLILGTFTQGGAPRPSGSSSGQARPSPRPTCSATASRAPRETKAAER
jgi:hypothetical protein